jgi:hypothetical protein
LGVAEVADLRLTAARWYEDRLSVELTEGTGAGAWPVRVEVFESFNGGLSPAEPRVPLVVAEGVWPGTENPTVPTTMIMSGLERPQTTGVLLAVVNRPSPETMPDLFAADNWRVVTGKLGVDAVSTMSGALAYPEWVQPPAYHFIGSRHILAGRIRAPEDRGTVATTATVTTAKPDREGSLITGIQVAAFPIPALEKGQTEDLTLSWFSMDLVHYLIVLQVEVSEDDQSRGAQVPAPHVYLPRYD